VDEQTKKLIDRITLALEALVTAGQQLTDSRLVATDRGVNPTDLQLTDAGYWFTQAELTAAVALVPGIQAFLDTNRAAINQVRKVS
jgi:hypothetical protein